MEQLVYLVYALPLLMLFAWLGRRRRHLERRSMHVHESSREAGLLDPVSLHPVIDLARCIGCGSCVKACPEQPEHQVLGLINGRAQLVSPTDCIGHGACKAICPVNAITLVFGTERRGVDIPLLTPKFETTVPGIFIAGELGGMGLIRNALEQGRQAIEAIDELRGRDQADLLDVVIVGAGPAGFSASLTALSRRMRVVTLEQEMLGGCVYQYPRAKMVMTSPAQLPLVGTIQFHQTSKEALLDFWRQVESKTGVRVNYRERVESITGEGNGFVVETTLRRYRTRSVLLSIGRRGTPRKLGVPGEDLPKVVYRLIEPEQYAHQNVLVVGGGDSALEAAASIAEVDGAKVVLSYRGPVFERARALDRERVFAAQRQGQLRVMLNSTVRGITPFFVTLHHPGGESELPNDAVIVNAGGVLPTEFLKRIGIDVETKYGTA